MTKTQEYLIKHAKDLQARIDKLSQHRCDSRERITSAQRVIELESSNISRCDEQSENFEKELEQLKEMLEEQGISPYSVL